jgi:carboxyl-terminal processing protease
MELDDYVSASYQNLRPLGSLLVTIQKFYRINGGATQLKGVTPDIILPDAYSEIELGEREQDYCMPWTKISPANYKPWTGLTNLETVVQKENASLAVNPDFKVIKEQALQFKKQHNETSVSLNLQKYDKHENEVMVRGVKYESLEKKSNGLKIHTLLIDDQEAKGDTAILVRTKNWVKDLGYDLYLKEAVQVVGFINTK